ncbi:MAG TPA: hypothetical protein VNX88_19690 [Terriglobales bacterium]|jgi:hypothetical protein|nr:hypothetical protein [Terriglobales bacterium]
MEVAILEARADLGWKAVPETCPTHIARIISEKRTRMLRKRQNLSSTPAAPAIAPERISDSDRNALASRLNNAIRLF